MTRLLKCLITAMVLSASACATSQVDPFCLDEVDCGEATNNQNNSNNLNNSNNANNTNQTDVANNLNNISVDVGLDAIGDTSADVDLREYNCLDRPPPANRVRKALAAFPYNGPGITEVYDLSEEGTLTKINRNFPTGAMSGRNWVFTDDGSFAFGNRDDGLVVSIRFNPDGTSVLVNGEFDAGVQFSGLIAVVGDRLIGWRFQTTADGGGLYQMAMDCVTGELGPAQLLVPGEYIWHVVPSSVRGQGNVRFLVSATSLGTSAEMTPLHYYDPITNTYLSGTLPAGATTGLPTGLLITRDEKFALLGENAFAAGVQDRISFANLNGDVMTPGDSIVVDEPIYLIASPHDNLVISLPTLNVSAGIKALAYDSNNAAVPLTVRPPHIPTPGMTLVRGFSQVDRGELAGLVLVAETQGIRLVRMAADQTVTSTFVPTGTEREATVGKIGIQP